MKLQNINIGYSLPKKPIMLKSLLTEPMRSNLRLVQIDELKRIDKKNNIGISPIETNYLSSLYINFVLNNTRFEDKIVKPKTVKVVSQPHIGIQMLNNMAAEAFYSDKRFKLTE